MRPFARHPKRKAEDDQTPNAADEFAQFFSNDPRPSEPPAEPVAAVEPPAPAVTMEEQSSAGWYPDTKDPGLMRYWDGFHLTGQTMRVGPPPPAAPEPSEAPAATPPAPTAEVVPSGPPAPPARFGSEAPAPPPLLGSRLLADAQVTTVTPPQPPEAVSAQSETSSPTMDQPVPAPNDADAESPAEVVAAAPVSSPSAKAPAATADDKDDNEGR